MTVLASWFSTASIAGGVTLCLTPAVRWLSRRLDLMDHPGERKMHVTPTPRSGGLAILGGVLAALWGSGALHAPGTPALAAGAIVLAVLAICDELMELRVVFRLLVQLAVVCAAVSLGRLVEGAAWVPGGMAMAAIAAVLWITWLLNAYNFMDGVNGIASVQAVVSGVTLALLLAAVGDVPGATMAVAIAAAGAAFLPWNMGGSIFMGDAGSATLGFLLGALVLRASAQMSPVAAALPLLPFLLDATFTLVRRMVRGERFYQPHRTHVYQRLVGQGWSHALVTSLYGALAAACGATALVYARLATSGRVASVVLLVLVHAIIARAVYVRDRRGA